MFKQPPDGEQRKRLSVESQDRAKDTPMKMLNLFVESSRTKGQRDLLQESGKKRVAVYLGEELAKFCKPISSGDFTGSSTANVLRGIELDGGDLACASVSRADGKRPGDHGDRDVSKSIHSPHSTEGCARVQKPKPHFVEPKRAGYSTGESSGSSSTSNVQRRSDLSNFQMESKKPTEKTNGKPTTNDEV
jgi:hypothetical protein